MGRLRVIYEERRQGFYYISTSKRVTLNIREALIVTFTPSSEPHYIGCFVSMKSRTKSIEWMTDVLEPALGLW